jgi:hypothetical protein
VSDGHYFIRVRDSAAARDLARKPHALALLWLIALRAHRGSGTNIHGLKFGQAFVGDLAACGLTEKQYRVAKAMLQRGGLATFKGATKGTVATLLDSSIFDVSFNTEGEQRANKGRARGGQGATNIESDGYCRREGEGTPACPASSSPSPAARSSDDAGGLAPELVAKWRPAFEALSATGKLPQLGVIHLVMVDRAHPGARLAEAEGFGEIVADALGMRAPVGDVGAWLRAKVGALEARRLGIGRRGGAAGPATDRAARVASVTAGVPAEWCDRLPAGAVPAGESAGTRGRDGRA